MSILMRIRHLAFALISCSLCHAAPRDGVCNVMEFGAAADGATNDAPAIQRAIEACAKAGGGVVLLPVGNFLSGSIELRSNITLRILPGATLTGSRRLEDYSPPHLINIKGVENAAVDGGGRIHASGDAWRRDRSDHPYLLGLRPRPSPTVEIADSKGVRVENVGIRETPGWGIHLLRSDEVVIRGVSLISHLRGPNTDGIDIDSSRNVRVADCYIEGGDDAIVLKTPRRAGAEPRPVENVTITNCVMTSTSNCFKIGTESASDFKNIAITNCVMYKLPHAFRAPISGIAIESVDGGTIDGLVASNITMRDVGTPIFIRLGNRGRGMETPRPGELRNVSISNVVATGSLITSSVTGLPGHRVRRVSLDNINISMKGGEREQPGLDVPELADHYPEAWMFGTLPAHGLYARHAEGLTLRNVQLHWEAEDVRPAMVLDDVWGLTVDGFQTETAAGDAALIRMHNAGEALIHGARVPAGTKALVEVTGSESRDIRIHGGLLRGARPVIHGPEAPAPAVGP